MGFNLAFKGLILPSQYPQFLQVALYDRFTPSSCNKSLHFGFPPKNMNAVTLLPRINVPSSSYVHAASRLTL